MACFLAPMAEAIGVSIVQKTVGKEKAKKWRLGWLNKLLWGGVILLAIEHIWHGEVVPWPPFLTAMENPGDVAPMLHEIATTGVIMVVVVTAVWAIMVVIAIQREKPIAKVRRAEEISSSS
ncbi:hypothetical protein ACFLWY_00570 [Chloroflexota bacterium]